MKPVKILVVGDIVTDTVVLPLFDDIESPTRHHGTTRTSSHGSYLRHSTYGGTALLAKAVHAAVARSKEGQYPSVYSYDEARLVGTTWRESLITLDLYPKTGDVKRTRDNVVYRIDKVLGWVENQAHASGLAAAEAEQTMRALASLATALHSVHDARTKTHKLDPGGKRLVVVNDRDKGFRDLSTKTLKTLAPRLNETHFILLMDHPLRKALSTPLWKLISSDACRRR